MAHKHSVHDTDNHFIIDPISRSIRQESGKTKLMQHDHNSERYTFELPRYIEGHDMILCDDIKIHYINVGVNKSDQSEGPYPVTDMQISPDGEEVIIFSWLISGNATLYAGSLSFAISFACLDGANIDYAWHTDTFSGITISGGIHNEGLDIILEYHDVLIEWEKRLFGSGSGDSSNSGSGSGEDGFSPKVNVETITGGHRVTITDVDGPKSFDVLDGKTPAKGTDYFTDTDKQEFMTAVLNALPTWEGGSY